MVKLTPSQRETNKNTALDFFDAIWHIMNTSAEHEERWEEGGVTNNNSGIIRFVVLPP